MPNLAFGNFFLLRVPEDLSDLLLENFKGIHFWMMAQRAGSGSAGAKSSIKLMTKCTFGGGGGQSLMWDGD
jgi:hypothetical protein